MAFFGLFNRTKKHGDIPAVGSFGNNTNLNARNPNFQTFDSVRSSIEDIIANRSVINNNATERYGAGFDNSAFETLHDNITAMPVITDKYQRIRQYRQIAAFPEVTFCLEEIADDFIHEDETGDFIKLNLNEDKSGMNEDRTEVLQNEFKKFINLFKFEDDGFNMIKRFFIEGEMAYENIINPEHPDLGIAGIRFLPTEYYETLVDPSNGNKVGIYFDNKTYTEELRTVITQSYYGSRQIFNNMFGSNMSTFSRDNCIPMAWPQVTYINSGELSPDGMICFPLVERAKQAYYQLALLQDAAVILRVTRAPEKLLFNLNTGNMNDKKAEDTLRRFAMQLKSKKVVGNQPKASGDSPSLTGVYNPSTMCESWIFGKSSANEGTTVESVTSTAQYEQMEDIKYFLKRLIKQFKVPWSRFETPENTIEKNDSITYEEYAFSRMEIRMQRRVASGLKKSFIVHLKLRGIWEKYGLKESDVDVKFVPPVLYDLYQTQKLMETRVAAYATIADRDELSKMIAMKNILHMSDDEIKENYDAIVKERMLLKLAEIGENKLDESMPKGYKFPMELESSTEEDTDNTANTEDAPEQEDTGFGV